MSYTVLRRKSTKFDFGAGRAYSAPPDLLAGGEGAGCPLSKNPTTALGPEGIVSRAFARRSGSSLFIIQTLLDDTMNFTWCPKLAGSKLSLSHGTT